MRLSAALAVLAALAAGTAHALPAGMGLPDDGAHITLSAEARAEVENDEATVLFSVVRSGPQLDAVTREVITAVNDGLPSLRGHFSSAVFRTENFTSRPRYSDREKKRIVSWEVRQDISARLPALQAAALVGALSENFSFENVSFSLSFEAQTRVQKRLAREAVAAAAARAESAALAMGAPASEVELESVKLGERSYVAALGAAPRAMVRNAEGESDAMPIPTFDRGRSAVTLSAQAVFLVKRQVRGVAEQAAREAEQQEAPASAAEPAVSSGHEAAAQQTAAQAAAAASAS